MESKVGVAPSVHEKRKGRMMTEEPWDVVEPSEEDRLIEILAKQTAGERLSRAEKKVLNKAEWAAKSKAVNSTPARMPIATPAGAKQRMREFKEKLLTAHNGNNVIRKVMDVAMNDEHPGQMAALKLCMDRMLPTSLFEEKKETGKSSISISITGIGEAPITINNETGEVDE